MGQTSFLGLVENAALLLAVAMIFDLAAVRWRPGKASIRQVPVGLAIGVIGIIVMLTPWSFAPGIEFDTRSVLIGISGLFFGSFATVVVAAMTAAFRFYQGGGAGAWTGVAVIFISGAIGVVWRHFRREPLADMSLRELFLFGMVIHLAMLAAMFTLPLKTALQVLSEITLPVLVILPAVTALLGALMTSRLRRERMESELRESGLRIAETNQIMSAILGNTRMLAVFLDRRFNIVWVNSTYAAAFGKDPSFFPGRNLFDLSPDGELQKIFRRVADTGEPSFTAARPFAFPNRPEGSPTFWDWSLIPLKDASESVTGLVFTLADVTERIRTEEKLRRNEGELQSLIESLINAFIIFESVFDGEGRFISCRFLYANEACEKSTGAKIRDLAGRTVHEIWPGTEPEWIRRFGEVASTGVPQTFELYHAPTRQFYHCNVYRPWEGKDRFCVVFEDITGRRQTEAALRESEKKYRTLVETSQDLIYTTDNKGFLTYVNPALEKILGYGEHELQGQPFSRIAAPEFIDTAREIFRRAMKGEHILVYEGTLVTKEGKNVTAEFNTTTLFDAEGKTSGRYAIGRDITERRKMEQALRKSEERFRRAVENIPDMVTIYDPGLRIQYVNAAARRITGRPPSDFLGKREEEIWPPGVYGAYLPVLREALETGKAHSLETEITLPDTGMRNLGFVFIPLSDGKENISELLGITHDSTEHRRNEQALRESEEKFRLLVNQLPDVIFAISKDLDILHISPNVEKVLGYRPEELEGRNVRDLNIMAPGYQEKVLSYVNYILRGNVVSSSVLEFLDRDGERLIAEVSGARLMKQEEVVAVICVGRDITDRVRAENERATLERQLYQSQKMESIGTLAGGIAHDFNNLLMSMQGNTSMMMEDLDPSHPHREYLKSIEIQIRSAASLTKQLLGFARGDLYDTRPSDINEIVENTASVFARTKKEIRLHRTYETDLWTVEADGDQMGQVFMNLFVNAWQAMPEGGDLILETENVLLDEAYVKPHRAAPGRYVKISVTDTGVGMDEKTMQRIFEPFFTTKERGKGTGLGLSMVYGITKGHKGFVTVSSEPRKGSTFNVFLPASEREIAAGTPASPHVIQGKGTILLVDDETQVLQVTRKMLERLGYAVLTADSGPKAVDLYRKRKETIDLVLLDMIMPGMSGERVFQLLREMNPGVRVILSSGYNVNGQAMKILDGGYDGFLQKPIPLDELSRKIHEVLKGKRGN
jgi:PAS domain S-box-containing protein